MLKRGILALLISIVLIEMLVFAVPNPDDDGDGYCPYIGTDCPDQLDCNDNNPEISPTAEEVSGDGIDNDCNGIIDDACTDSDMDGYNSTASAGGIDCGGAPNVDCDDANVFVNPGIPELCANDIDDDCDGNMDEDDSDCTEPAVESNCEIYSEMTMWINCDGENINAANEGDTVYMLLWTEGCDENSDVVFKVYEFSGGVGTEEDSITATEENKFTNIIDEEGNPTDMDIWLVPWSATYIADDDDTNPEYYFEAKLTERSGASFKQDSGKTRDSLLSVTGCDGCGIECSLNMESIFGEGTEGGTTTLMYPPCQVTADCSGVEWSECNPATGKMTRDTSLCVLTGTGTVECQKQAIALAPSEKLCSSSANPSEKRFGTGKAECGDGICDEGEKCPEDCGEKIAKGGFPWLWILIAIIIIGAVTTGIILVYKKKKKDAAVVAKPGEKKEEMPFAAQKDLDSILAYIRAAKGKGYKDEQITEALKKAGWKDDQIKYAFNKINNPQQANAKPAVQQPGSAVTAQKPDQAANTGVNPVQQAAQSAKK